MGVRARGPAGVEELVDALYRQVPTYTTLDRDADRLLDARVPFGIVTNGSRYQTHTIQALGLDTRTSCILVSELVGGRKADAAIFAAAEDGLSMARMLPSPDAEAHLLQVYGMHHVACDQTRPRQRKGYTFRSYS